MPTNLTKGFNEQGNENIKGSLSVAETEPVTTITDLGKTGQSVESWFAGGGALCYRWTTLSCGSWKAARQ